MSRKGGPRPEPIPLKILKGNGRGLDVGGRPIPQVPPFERCEPTAPSWLVGEALALWEQLVPPLAALDILKAEDTAVLSALCSAYGELVETDAIIRREGATVTNPTSGHVAAHPLIPHRASARRAVLALSREFGLSPASEQDLGRPPSVPEDDENDPFAASSNYGS